MRHRRIDLHSVSAIMTEERDDYSECLRKLCTAFEGVGGEDGARYPFRPGSASSVSEPQSWPFEHRASLSSLVKPSEREHRGIPLQLGETATLGCLRPSGVDRDRKTALAVGDGQKESPSIQTRARSYGRPSFYAVTASSSPSAPTQAKVVPRRSSYSVGFAIRQSRCRNPELT